MAELVSNAENEHCSNFENVRIAKGEDLIKDLPEVIIDAHGIKHKICKADFEYKGNK